jgi:hypothetical protein
MHAALGMAAIAMAAAAQPALAADWSDTAIGVRYGTKFAEPYNNNPDGSRVDIEKIIINFTHVSGYKYGSNFFNVDLLQSDDKDPGDGIPGNPGAQEVYAVYRHLLDIGKVAGKDKEWKSGWIRGYGLTAGFDFNSKNDAYASKKRMFVIGPTVMFEVPGFLNMSGLLLMESNAPKGIPSRYRYDNHGAFEIDWGIGLWDWPVSFNGYALFIASKGKNEFGGPTAAETHIDATLMADVGLLAGGPKKTFLLGLGYEYWKNKFGNPASDAGQGSLARTPMIRFEYHF